MRHFQLDSEIVVNHFQTSGASTPKSTPLQSPVVDGGEFNDSFNVISTNSENTTATSSISSTVVEETVTTKVENKVGTYLDILLIYLMIVIQRKRCLSWLGDDKFE